MPYPFIVVNIPLQYHCNNHIASCCNYRREHFSIAQPNAKSLTTHYNESVCDTNHTIAGGALAVWLLILVNRIFCELLKIPDDEILIYVTIVSVLC